MFHSRKINNKINHLHEKSLRVVYNDMTSLFKGLVENFNRNLQILATVMFKVYNNTDLAVFTKIFSKQNLNYELRSLCGILYKGTESLLFLGLQNF